MTNQERYKTEKKRIKRRYLEACEMLDEIYYPRHMKKWWKYTQAAAKEWHAQQRYLCIKFATK